MTKASVWLATGFGGPEVLSRAEADVAPPGPGEVTIGVRAAGVNPADYKHFAPGQDPGALPLRIGYEVAGVITALGPGTELASGGGRTGDEVIASLVDGGYATALTVPAADVFAKPAGLTFAAAANLLLAGTTAAELLHVTGVAPGDTILVHGAAGAVGASTLQQARALGAHVVGTAAEGDFGLVRELGGTPVSYDAGLAERVRRAAPQGVTAALDTTGSDQAIDASLAVVADRARIVTTAAFGRAAADGFRSVGAANPVSGPFRARARSRIIALAAAGELTVPMARTFPLSQAPAALALLRGPHPAGKLALINDN
ncbi:MAG TPA: NADP-dependent oxidoreductase [Streptosporangiaceae bacterium]|nr:NADP-dependent oxidoreductase [Streptosporangiaceae bacterium]